MSVIATVKRRVYWYKLHPVDSATSPHALHLYLHNLQPMRARPLLFLSARSSSSRMHMTSTTRLSWRNSVGLWQLLDDPEDSTSQDISRRGGRTSEINSNCELPPSRPGWSRRRRTGGKCWQHWSRAGPPTRSCSCAPLG